MNILRGKKYILKKDGSPFKKGDFGEGLKTGSEK
jgi:hypothetical protein